MNLSSKVKIVEGEPGLRPIAAADSSVPAFVGVTERGPIATPVLVTSLGGFLKVFGGYLSGDHKDLPLAVRAFFANGGQSCYVVRTTHFADVGDPDSTVAVKSSANLTVGGNPSAAEIEGADYPLNLEPGDQVVISVDAGGDQTATFDAAAAYRVTAMETFDLEDGDTFTLRIDSPTAELQTITFLAADVVDIDAVTAVELRDMINAQIRGAKATVEGTRVKIESDSRGTGSRVIFVGGTAYAAIVDGVELEVVGTGDVANIDSVSAAEAKAVIEADVAGVVVDDSASALTIATVATGAAASLEPKAGTAAGFGLAEALTSGSDDALENVLRIEERYPSGLTFTADVVDATSGEADRFDLLISSGGTLLEAWRNVSANETESAYLVDELTEATSIFAAVDLGAAGDPRPDNQSATIDGGDAGLTGLVDADFVGGEGTGKTGLRALDEVLDLTLVAIPGRASLEIATGLRSYCETTRSGFVFAVHDTPSGLTYQEAVEYVETTSGLLGATEFGAVYWPHVKVSNPSAAVFGSASSLTAPPSGSILGLYARVDGRRDGGVYDSPAGWEIAALDILGIESESANLEAVRDVVYPKRINPIHTDPGRPFYVDGGRTLKEGGNFPNISERRGVILIKSSIKRGIDFARHKPHDESLRARIRRSVTAFLRRQMLVGAFRSREEEEAFYLICDETNNPLEVVLSGKVVVTIGVATQKPAEFIEVEISQDTRGFTA